MSLGFGFPFVVAFGAERTRPAAGSALRSVGRLPQPFGLEFQGQTLLWVVALHVSQNQSLACGMKVLSMTVHVTLPCSLLQPELLVALLDDFLAELNEVLLHKMARRDPIGNSVDVEVVGGLVVLVEGHLLLEAQQCITGAGQIVLIDVAGEVGGRRRLVRLLAGRQQLVATSTHLAVVESLLARVVAVAPVGLERAMDVGVVHVGGIVGGAAQGGDSEDDVRVSLGESVSSVAEGVCLVCTVVLTSVRNLSSTSIEL